MIIRASDWVGGWWNKRWGDAPCGAYNLATVPKARQEPRFPDRAKNMNRAVSLAATSNIFRGLVLQLLHDFAHDLLDEVIAGCVRRIG